MPKLEGALASLGLDMVQERLLEALLAQGRHGHPERGRGPHPRGHLEPNAKGRSVVKGGGGWEWSNGQRGERRRTMGRKGMME
eukprot:7698461-Pyramimonas_sp.AAC.1